MLRVFTVSTALAAVITVTSDTLPGLAAKSGTVAPTHEFLSAITLFACYGAVYSVYSPIFGVRVTARQTLFCFALVLVPWLPVFALLKYYGGDLGVAWFFLFWGPDFAFGAVDGQSHQHRVRSLEVPRLSVFRARCRLGHFSGFGASVRVEVRTETIVTASSATVGTPEVFTAKVTVISGSGTPTGSVKFLGADGITYYENAPLDANGTARFSTIIARGASCVQAQYSGDSRAAPSTSTIRAFSVLDAPATPALPEPAK